MAARCRNLAMAFALALLLAGCYSTQKDSGQEEKIARIHYQIAIDALNKGLLPKAFDELMLSDSLLPNQPEVQDAFAYAWRLRGDFKKSEAFYRRSLRLKQRAVTQNNFASLLIRLKRYKQAEKMTRKALDDPRYPNQDLVFINLGDALLGQGKFNAAIDSYHQAQLFNPGILPQLKEARAYLQFNRLEQARALYGVLLRKQSGGRIVAKDMLTVLKKQNDFAAARRMLSAFRQQVSSEQDKAWADEQLLRLQQ